MFRCSSRIVLVAVLAFMLAGCFNDRPDPTPLGDAYDSAPSSTYVDTYPDDADAYPSASPTPTDDTTQDYAPYYGTATRDRAYVTRDGVELDAAALQAIGWTIDAERGTATWSVMPDETETVEWDVPPQEANVGFELAFGVHATAPNLAVGPVSWKSSFFTIRTPQESGTWSKDGVTAYGPQKKVWFDVPDERPGAQASVSLDMGFPVPVLLTYTYVYR